MSSIFDTGGYIGTSATYPTVIPTIVSSGLVLHLDAGETASYPGTGTTWFDLSGNGNNATLYNSPTWSGSGGGSFTFNGSNQYAQCAAGFANFTGGLTIFAIVNMGTGTNYERIIDFGSGAPVDNIIFNRLGTGTTLDFSIWNNTTTTGLVSIANGIIDNTIACYSATANGSTLKTYRNAVEIGTVNDTDLPPNVTRNNCYIGRSNWAADSYFAGTMHVLMIYNRGLTATEITQNYNFFKSRYGLT